MHQEPKSTEKVKTQESEVCLCNRHTEVYMYNRHAKEVCMYSLHTKVKTQESEVWLCNRHTEEIPSPVAVGEGLPSLSDEPNDTDLTFICGDSDANGIGVIVSSHVIEIDC